MVTNCRREKLSPEEAETEYVRSEKGVFNWLKVEQWRKVTSKSLWGLESVHYKTSEHKWHNTDKQIYWREVQGIVARVLSNQDEKKLSDQVVAEKLLELFKEKQIQQLKSYLWRIYCYLTR
jgi:trigger factor